MTKLQEPSQYWGSFFIFDRKFWEKIKKKKDISDRFKKAISDMQSEAQKPEQNELEFDFLSKIKYATEDYAFEMHNLLYATPTGEVKKRLESIRGTSSTLSRLLKEGECLFGRSHSHQTQKILNEVSSTLEDFTRLRLEEKNANQTSANEHHLRRQQLYLDDEENCDIKRVIDIAKDEILKKNPKTAYNFLVNKKISEMHEENFARGLHSTLFIYDLVEKLSELEQCVSDLQENIEEKPKNKGRAEAPYTGQYLKDIHDIYSHEFNTVEIDNDYNELAIALLNMVASSLKKSFGSTGREAIENMGKDAIRKAIERTRSKL